MAKIYEHKIYVPVGVYLNEDDIPTYYGSYQQRWQTS